MMIDWKTKTAEEIGRLFLDHWKYLETHGQEGKRAILQGFNLSEIDLTGANLRMANLSEANLESVNLRRAALTHSFMVTGDIIESDF